MKNSVNLGKIEETTLYKIIRLILVDALEVDSSLVALNANLEKDLGADSLDLYELLYQFEMVLSVEISDDEALEVFKTVGSLYRFLQLKCVWLENAETASDYWRRGNVFSTKYFALLCYEKAIELDSNCVKAYIGRGELYQKEEQFEHAIKDFSKILEISPDYPHIFYLRGNCYLSWADGQQVLNNMGDPSLGMDFRYDINDTLEKALDDFNNALKNNVENANALLGRAKTFHRMGKFEKSANDYKMAIKMSSALHETPEMLDLIEKGFEIIVETDNE